MTSRLILRISSRSDSCLTAKNNFLKTRRTNAKFSFQKRNCRRSGETVVNLDFRTVVFLFVNIRFLLSNPSILRLHQNKNKNDQSSKYQRKKYTKKPLVYSIQLFSIKIKLDTNVLPAYFFLENDCKNRDCHLTQTLSSCGGLC